MAATSISTPIQNVAARPRVAGLIRVSGAAQAHADRAGIPRQRRVIEQTIVNKGLDCLRIYEVSDVSGTQVRQNADVIEILQLVESKVISGLVVADLDRLFRPDEPTDYAILQVFKDSGAIIYSGETEYNLGQRDSALFTAIRSAISGWELGLIKERMQGAKEAKRRAGKCPTNAATLRMGVSFDRKTETWSWNERAHDVVAIFNRFDAGERNYSQLGREFGLTGQTIRNILSDSIYASGERIIDEKRGTKRISRTGKTYRVKVKREADAVIRVKVLEPIISQEQFARCSQRIAGVCFNHQEGRKRDETFNLGSGIAYCGHCGERLYCSSGKRTNGKRHGQYICRRNYHLYKKELGGCTQPNLRQPDLDALIDAFAVKTLTDVKTLTAIIASSLQRTSAVVRQFPQSENRDSEVRALRRKENRLLDAYQDGAIELEEFRSRRDALRRRIAEASRSVTPATLEPAMSLELFAKRVVRGAFRLKRLTDAKEKKLTIQSLFSMILVKQSAIVGFKIREELGTEIAGQVIHLDTPFQLQAAIALPAGHSRCTKCSRILPAPQFPAKRAGGPDKRSRCRECVRDQAHDAYVRRKRTKLESGSRALR